MPQRQFPQWTLNLGPYIGQYQFFKEDNRTFEGHAYEVKDRSGAILDSGILGEEAKSVIINTEMPKGLRAFKAIMPESERITQAWEPKLESMAQAALESYPSLMKSSGEE